MEVVEEGEGLDGLAQAHFVCEDHVSVFVPAFYEPVDTGDLVGFEALAFFEFWKTIFFCAVKSVFIIFGEYFVSEVLKF